MPLRKRLALRYDTFYYQCMRKNLHLILLMMITVAAYGQNVPHKFALVIGNGAYVHTTKLNNPVNDANDIEAALKSMGFTVDKVLNGSQQQMVDAIMLLKKRLSGSRNSYGFLFYAGHGVQSNGENYLIPVDAEIPSENFLRNRAVSIQEMLDELNDAGNELNVVILDACRDNPFSWRRSGSRGLSIVNFQPADSIIVYATAAGSTAADGTGRNGLFTECLLKNLKTPGLEVMEMIRRTGSDVFQASNSKQVPAFYSQFFGTAYLGARPAAASPPAGVFESGTVSVATGALEISTVSAGIVEITGAGVNQRTELPVWGTLPITKINAGSYLVVMRYRDGKTEEKAVEIGRSEAKKLEFNYQPPQATAPTRIQPSTAPTRIQPSTAPNETVTSSLGPFSIRVQNDRAGRIQGAFTGIISDKSIQNMLNSGTNQRYLLDVIISISEVILPNSPYKFARLELTANLLDTGTGEVLLPYTFFLREGHTTQTEAENRCYISTERKINTEYNKILSDYLSGTSPKK